MKKKVFSIIGVAAFAVAMALNINFSAKTNSSDMLFANVEALAKGEIPGWDPQIGRAHV